MINITDKQINQLKSVLSKEEYNELMRKINNIGDFLDVLDNLEAASLDENDNITFKTNVLGTIYGELYNQN
jgi:hypothetical protein